MQPVRICSPGLNNTSVIKKKLLGQTLYIKRYRIHECAVGHVCVGRHVNKGRKFSARFCRFCSVRVCFCAAVSEKPIYSFARKSMGVSRLQASSEYTTIPGGFPRLFMFQAAKRSSRNGLIMWRTEQATRFPSILPSRKWRPHIRIHSSVSHLLGPVSP